MLHSGCVKLHQKFRDFVGLPMGLLREESPKNRMNTGLFGSRSGGVRPQSRSSRSAVQQALIYPNIVSKARDPLDPGLFFVRAGAGDRIFARTGLTNRGRCGTLCMISCI